MSLHEFAYLLWSFHWLHWRCSTFQTGTRIHFNLVKFDLITELQMRSCLGCQCNDVKCTQIMICSVFQGVKESVSRVGILRSSCCHSSFPILSFFLLILSVWKVPAFLPCEIGAYGWVTRICQPLELSPSRSWLPTAEACVCPQA